jgi:glycerophosphoryl diester phosphodiesterase
MKYIAHRGLWNEKIEQNTYSGIKRALDLGFGVELDVRDKNGELIVSHDPSCNSEVLLFQEIVQLCGRYDSMLAVNVKSDGILENMKCVLAELDRERFFLFDMSIPETMRYLESDLPTYMRLSEYEAYCELHEQSQGVWLDAFQDNWWFGRSDIFLKEEKICVVSPELHGRDKSAAWGFLKNLETKVDLYLCTDYPESAKVFFE